jgi:hypothetical protein
VLLVLPVEVPDFPNEEAGNPPLLLAWGGRVPETVPPPSWPGLPAELDVALPGVDAKLLLDAPGELLPDDGAPEVSGIAGTPLEPLLPPPRLSGEAGVRTSTPPADPAAVPAFFELAFPAGLLAVESGLLPQAASPSAKISTADSKENRPEFLADALEKPIMRDSRELVKSNLPPHG